MPRLTTTGTSSGRPFVIPRTFRKPKNVFNKIRKNISTRINKSRTARLRQQTNNLKRQEKVYGLKAKNQMARNKNSALINDAKLKAVQSKRAYRETKLNADAQRGGPIGYFARRRQRKIAENEAKIQMTKMEPKLSAKEREVRLTTDASVKKTRARGAAVATAVSALGSGIAAKAQAESQAKIAQAKADSDASKALVSSLNAVPQITEDQYSNGSASGLVTGVR